MKIIKEEFNTLNPEIDSLLLPKMFEYAGTNSANEQKLGFALVDENGETVGGIVGSMTFENFHINGLAIDERFRGLDYGTLLMDKMEKAVVEACAKLITLSTLSFQALGFYEKLGYKVFGILEDCPFEGATKYYLFKRL
ncbi:GNAT family N-acetyltransferase [Lactovum odontotermitis]